jgi:predicted DNA-binding transcriptional regulator AlpA
MNLENNQALLNAQTLAQWLAVSVRHLWRLADSGRMPRPFKLGRAVRWRAVDIENWLAGGCRPVGAEGSK